MTTLTAWDQDHLVRVTFDLRSSGRGRLRQGWKTVGKDVPSEGTGWVKGSGGRKREEPKDMRGAQRGLGWPGPGLDCAGPLRAHEGFGKSLKG